MTLCEGYSVKILWFPCLRRILHYLASLLFDNERTRNASCTTR